MTEPTQEIEEQPAAQPTAPQAPSPAMYFEGTEAELRQWFTGQLPVAGTVYGFLCTMIYEGVDPNGVRRLRSDLTLAQLPIKVQVRPSGIILPNGSPVPRMVPK